MSQQLARGLAWMCLVVLAVMVIAGGYMLININIFQQFMVKNILAPIQWGMVDPWQLYLAWLLTAIYVGVGLVGLAYLSQVLKRFGKGELFTLTNSRHLRGFASCLLLQSLFSPFYFGLLVVLLTLNHPAGQKVLMLNASSNDLKNLGLGILLWLISDLLVKAQALEKENKAFV
jgi:hypothetical protein